MIIPRKINKRVEMIFRTMISFPWVVVIYSDDSWRYFSLPCCYIFNILWFRCGPGYCLRGRVVGDGLWGQASASATITKFWILLVNHPILWRIFMTIRLMTWKKGWIYGQGWMWIQCSMENSLRIFTWHCGSFSLLLRLPSSGVMCCGVLFLW